MNARPLTTVLACNLWRTAAAPVQTAVCRGMPWKRYMQQMVVMLAGHNPDKMKTLRMVLRI